MLSLICMALIIAVLVTAKDRSLESWLLAIQPNSLVSVLTTVGKSAMVVVITSCISQLKWRYFQTRAHPLNHIQCFDDASRGSWGALTFLGGIRVKSALVASGLSLVAILALGFEPCAQQILEFPSRIAKLENETAYIGQALSYESNGFGPIHVSFSDSRYPVAISPIQRPSSLPEDKIEQG